MIYAVPQSRDAKQLFRVPNSTVSPPTIPSPTNDFASNRSTCDSFAFNQSFRLILFRLQPSPTKGFASNRQSFRLQPPASTPIVTPPNDNFAFNQSLRLILFRFQPSPTSGQPFRLHQTVPPFNHFFFAGTMSSLTRPPTTPARGPRWGRRWSRE